MNNIERLYRFLFICKMKKDRLEQLNNNELCGVLSQCLADDRHSTNAAEFELS